MLSVRRTPVQLRKCFVVQPLQCSVPLSCTIAGLGCAGRKTRLPLSQSDVSFSICTIYLNLALYNTVINVHIQGHSLTSRRSFFPVFQARTFSVVVTTRTRTCQPQSLVGFLRTPERPQHFREVIHFHSYEAKAFFFSPSCDRLFRLTHFVI